MGPAHDFYSTIAAVVPLLLITSALEARRLGGSDAPDLLDLPVLFFAVGAEICAFVGLAGGPRIMAGYAAGGTGLLGTCMIAPIAWRLRNTSGGKIRQPVSSVFALATALAPTAAGLAYLLQLAVA